MKGIALRIILTLILFSICSTFSLIENRTAVVASGELSVRQLNGGNADYVVSTVGQSLLSNTNIAWFLFIIFVLIIWWKPVNNWWTTFGAVFLALCLIGVPAHAYYDTVDNPEFIEIQPNQTAFMIPLQGDNKSSQAAFMSEQYLVEKKVPAKRVEIKHTLVKNALFGGRDYYIPVVKLVIVDRTPCNREWTSPGRGTNKNLDESFRFETAESFDGRTGVSVSAFVKEEDAPKFLYWFGTKAEPNSTDPKIMYASVAYGKSLAEVVDTNVRTKVQILLSREFGKRPIEKAIAEKSLIMETIQKEIIESFAALGITVTAIGYAEGITWDPVIQEAMNKVYIAGKTTAASDLLAKAMPILQQQADINVKQGFATAINKWNGQLPSLPSFLVVPPDLIKGISGWFEDKSVKTNAK